MKLRWISLDLGGLGVAQFASIWCSRSSFKLTTLPKADLSLCNSHEVLIDGLMVYRLIYFAQGLQTSLPYTIAVGLSDNPQAWPGVV